MQLMVVLVYGFAVLSALIWLYALAVNVGLSIVRWTSDHLIAFSSVRLVGTLAGFMAYFSSLPLWRGWSVVWLLVLASPDIVAAVSDAVYYRNQPARSAKDSDNPGG